MEDLRYNTEHYRDSTVYLALKNIMREEKRLARKNKESKQKSRNQRLKKNTNTEDEE